MSVSMSHRVPPSFFVALKIEFWFIVIQSFTPHPSSPLIPLSNFNFHLQQSNNTLIILNIQFLSIFTFKKKETNPYDLGAYIYIAYPIYLGPLQLTLWSGIFGYNLG